MVNNIHVGSRQRDSFAIIRLATAQETIHIRQSQPVIRRAVLAQQLFPLPPVLLLVGSHPKKHYCWHVSLDKSFSKF